MQTKTISQDELAVFKQYLVPIKYPATPSEKGNGSNPTVSAQGYNNYPTSKNQPDQLKGAAESRMKSTGELPGYTGDVLKSDKTIREGKGLQQHVNGTVFEGYFFENRFIKGRMIDAVGTMITGSFLNEKIQGPAQMKSEGGMVYDGLFENGTLCGKGTLTWISPDNRELKFNGIYDGQSFVSGKFEIKLNKSTVQTIEGVFNVPFIGFENSQEEDSPDSVGDESGPTTKMAQLEETKQAENLVGALNETKRLKSQESLETSQSPITTRPSEVLQNNQELDKIKFELLEARQKISAKQVDYDAIKEQLDEAQKQTKDLKGQLQQREQLLQQKADESLSSINKIKELHLNQVNELNLKLDQQKKQISEQQNGFEAEKQKSVKIQTMIETLNKTSAAEIEELKRSHKTQIVAHEKQIQELQSNLAQQKSQVIELQTQNEKKIQELLSQIATEKNKNTSRATDQEASASAIEELKKQHNTQIEKHLASIQELTKAKLDHAKEFTQVKELNSESEKKIKELLVQAEAGKKALADQQAATKDLEGKLQQITSKNSTESANIGALQKDYDNVKSQMSKLESELTSSGVTINQKDSLIKTLKEDLEQINKKFSSQSSELSAKAAEVVNLQSKASSTAKVEDGLKQKQAEIDQLTQQLKLVEQKALKANEQVNEIQVQQKKEHAEHEQKLKQAAQNSADAIKKLAEATSAKENLEKEILKASETYQTDLLKMKKLNETREEQLRQCDVKIVGLNKNVQELQENLAKQGSSEEISKLKTQIEGMLKEQQQNEASHNQKVKLLETENAKSAQDLKQFKSQLDKANTEIRNLKINHEKVLIDTKTKSELAEKTSAALKVQIDKQVQDVKKQQEETQKLQENVKKQAEKLEVEKQGMVEKLKSELKIKFDIHENYQTKLNEIAAKEAKLSGEITQKQATLKKDKSQLEKDLKALEAEKKSCVEKLAGVQKLKDDYTKQINELKASYEGKLEQAKQINWPVLLGVVLLVALLSATLARQM